MNEWKPIETAPKDGTEVLLWGALKEGMHPWKYIGSWFPSRDGGFWVAHALRIHPTNWAPLPPPPEVSE